MALELFKPFIMSRLVERKQVQNIKAAKKLVDAMVPEVWDVLEEVIGEHPVLLNRAPTLHRLGIQAFEPVLVEGKAIQIHPLVCTAFNADFDGDQMAVHLPLSVEAQAEARILMLSANNILSPAHGRPIAVPSQDMVLGLYYLTYAQVLDVRNKKDTESEGQPRELLELWNPEKRKWEIPRNHEARVEGGDWSTKPFDGIAAAAPVRERRRGADRRWTSGPWACRTSSSCAGPTARAGSRRPAGWSSTTRSARPSRRWSSAEELEEHPFPERHETLTKRNTGDFIEELVNVYGATAVSMVLDAFKALGFRYASESGLTVSKNDIVVPPTKGEIIAKYDAKVDEVEEFFAFGEMSPEERHEEVIKLWEQATDEVADAMEKHLFRLNPIYMMANSGARGSFKQIRQLAGMRGCMNNPKGETIERPIKSNFMEGLSVLEYFISTHGARKGLADTALKTADSGYLTRRLVDVSQDVIVRELDCGTDEGIEVPVFRDDGTLNPSLPGRVVLGPVVERGTGEVLVDVRPEPETDDEEEAAAARRGHMVSTADGQQLDIELRDDARVPRDAVVTVRSPLKCRSEVGICARCYGRNPASGRLTEPGDAVGIIAAQSIGEPGTQLTMRTFHTGGVAGADITHGLPRVVELFEARKPKAQAHIAPVDGWIRIVDDETRPGSATLEVVEPEYIEQDDAGTGATRAPVREHTFAAMRRTQIRVDDGQWVEAGDLLTTGSAFPAEILASKPGVALGVTGKVKRVKDEGKGWMRVDVDTEAGTSQRWLRLPDGHPLPEGLEKGAQVTAGERFYAQDGVRDRSTKTELYLVREVQNVYRSQGVDINDKHIELIVRQMLRKVRVENPGGTHFLHGQLVDKPVLYRENVRAAERMSEQLLSKRESGEFTGDDDEITRGVEGVQASYEPLILGITKASLATESFLSAASFQETTKVLTDAALEGKVDRLRGLKENVIIGKLIPAATGLKRYRQLEIEAVRRAPALLEFDLDEPFSEADDDALLSLGDGDGGTYSFGPELEGEDL